MATPAMKALLGAHAAAGGGISDPTEVSGLVGWYDPSDTSSITSSGGSVSQINDKSGLARHATQGTGSYQPSTGAATINSLNVLSFSGTDRGVQAASAQWVSATTGNYTAFGIFKPSTVAAGTSHVINLDTGAGTRLPQPLRRDAAALQALNITGGVVGDGNGQTLSAGTAYIGASTLRSADIESFINGLTDGATATTGAHATGTAPLSIGWYGDTAGSELFRGDIGEVVIYNTDLSDADINLIGNYLSSKWGPNWADL